MEHESITGPFRSLLERQKERVQRSKALVRLVGLVICWLVGVIHVQTEDPLFCGQESSMGFVVLICLLVFCFVFELFIASL